MSIAVPRRCLALGSLDDGHRPCGIPVTIETIGAFDLQRRNTDQGSVFEYMPSLTLDPSSVRQGAVLMRSEPTKSYGVGLVSSRSSGGVRCSGLSSDQHGLWLQRSAPIAATTRIGGRLFDYRPGPGSINIRPPGMETITDIRGPVEGIIIRISAECIALAREELGTHGGTPVERIDASDRTLFQMGCALEAEAVAGHPNGLLYWNEGADALVRHVATHHFSKSGKPPTGMLAASDLARVDQYVRANLSEALDVPCLAALVDCDRFQFSHRFRRATGVSPHRYVVRRRLERACAMIRAGRESLAEVSLATGFSDQSHLCRWMRRIYNLSPKDLRADGRPSKHDC